MMYKRKRADYITSSEVLDGYLERRNKEYSKRDFKIGQSLRVKDNKIDARSMGKRNYKGKIAQLTSYFLVLDIRTKKGKHYPESFKYSDFTTQDVQVMEG